MDIERLKKIVEDDHLNLLDVKPKNATELSEEDRLAESFFEIVNFYRAYHREPEKSPSNMQEAQLAMRLEAIRENPEKIKMLLDLDEFDLLIPEQPPESIDDLLKEDTLGLLDSDPSNIFTLRHVSQTKKNEAEFVAKRKPCPNFNQFEPIFKQCQIDLKTGTRTLFQTVREDQITAGRFYVLSGVLMYLAKVGKDRRKLGRRDPRLHCVFENGTESNMLFRSLIKSLMSDGYCVSDHKDQIMQEMNAVSDEDAETGFIYILQSLSSDPEIIALKNLYKIGFSTISVEERIKNAADDPTYLMAPVQIIKTFRCFNLNPQKLELLLHRFFGKACLEVDVFDHQKKRHTPREWFNVPLPIIEETIKLIISGKIINYQYDHQAELIIPKQH